MSTNSLRMAGVRAAAGPAHTAARSTERVNGSARTPRRPNHDHHQLVGFGYQESHHGEVVQGPVLADGEIETAIITLPRSALAAKAVFRFSPTADDVFVTPSHKSKAAQAARTVLAGAGLSYGGGELILKSNIIEGGGNGSSTSDILATLKAVSDAIDLELDPAEIQRICFEIEGASDPLALIECSRTPVYGSRCGEVFRWVNRGLPPVFCVGFITSPDETVETDSLIGQTYSMDEVREFTPVLRKAEAGIASGRADIVAEAATESARLNQARLTTRHFDALVQLSDENGGLGVSVSHSGVVGAIHLHPELRNLDSRIAHITNELRNVGCTNVASFGVGFCNCG